MSILDEIGYIAKVTPDCFSVNSMPKEEKDNINPDHYKAGGMEVIDILRAKLTPEQFEGFCAGNVIKYTLRARMKNGAEDLKKAAWYSPMLAGVDPRK